MKRNNYTTAATMKFIRVYLFYLSGGTIASALVGALCVQVVSPRFVGVVAPGDLKGTRAIWAIPRLEKGLSALQTGVAIKEGDGLYLQWMSV